jgi:diamine N-acetyltransferase
MVGRTVRVAAMQRFIGHERAKRLFAALQPSYVPGPGCPEPFDLGLGFRHTGRVEGDEIVLELPLEDDAT